MALKRKVSKKEIVKLLYKSLGPSSKEVGNTKNVILDDNVHMAVQFMLGKSKADISEEFGLTRERVRQIIHRVAGRNNPSFFKNYDVDWDALNRIRIMCNIGHTQIAKRSGACTGTSTRAFNGTLGYKSTPSAIKVLGAFLRIVLEQLDSMSRINDTVLERSPLDDDEE